MHPAKQHTWIRPVLETLAPTFREVLALSLFVNLLALAVPVFVLQVYDRVIFHAGLNTLYGLVIGMAFVLLFDFVLRQSRARILQTVAARIDVEVSRRLFDKLMAMPLPFLERQPAAYWHALFRDVEMVRNTLSGASALLIADLPFAVLFLGLTFLIAAPIAWILLAMLPVFLFVAWRSGNATAANSQAERDSGLNRDRLLAEIIASRTTVKALALEAAMRPRWEERQADCIERAIVRGASTDSFSAIGTSLTLFTTVTLTAVGAIAILDQRMTVGALIATNLLSSRMLGPLTQLVSMWRTYTGFAQAVARLGDAFSLPGERTTGAVALPAPRGEVALEDVSFAYAADARPTIQHVSLSIRAPGVHAIIGRNGSGKTTLLKLAQGLYPPTSGRVLIDGADIAQFTRRELAAWIGYVPQEPMLFSGTIRSNIAMRHPNADDEAVITAAQASGAHAFIVDLPDGYATDIGENGIRLSAGQRQRLAIARALLGNPSLLLLDEPSSNLDREAEHDLRRTLKERGAHANIVIVTHSPILLAACDHVVALEGGRVALAGTAADILPRLFSAASRPAPVTTVDGAGRHPPVVSQPGPAPVNIEAGR